MSLEQLLSMMLLWPYVSEFAVSTVQLCSNCYSFLPLPSSHFYVPPQLPGMHTELFKYECDVDQNKHNHTHKGKVPV